MAWGFLTGRSAAAGESDRLLAARRRAEVEQRAAADLLTREINALLEKIAAFPTEGGPNDGAR